VARSGDGVEAEVRAVPEAGVREVILNLDYGVSNDDIKELFSEVGDLKRCSINYDWSGRSKGTVRENLDTNRHVLKNAVTGEIVIKQLSKEQEVDQSNFRDAETQAELEVQDKLSLLEWFANEYKRFGCMLEFVTNKSQEGSQFCRGFGGIGKAIVQGNRLLFFETKLPAEVNLAPAVETTAAPEEDSPAKDERLDLTKCFAAGVFAPVDV
jgi:hypothetical protein